MQLLGQLDLCGIWAMLQSFQYLFFSFLQRSNFQRLKLLFLLLDFISCIFGLIGLTFSRMIGLISLIHKRSRTDDAICIKRKWLPIKVHPHPSIEINKLWFSQTVLPGLLINARHAAAPCLYEMQIRKHLGNPAIPDFRDTTLHPIERQIAVELARRRDFETVIVNRYLDFSVLDIRPMADSIRYHLTDAEQRQFINILHCHPMEPPANIDMLEDKIARLFVTKILRVVPRKTAH